MLKFLKVKSPTACLIWMAWFCLTAVATAVTATLNLCVGNYIFAAPHVVLCLISLILFGGEAADYIEETKI